MKILLRSLFMNWHTFFIAVGLVAILSLSAIAQRRDYVSKLDIAVDKTIKDTHEQIRIIRSEIEQNRVILNDNSKMIRSTAEAIRKHNEVVHGIR